MIRKRAVAHREFMYPSGANSQLQIPFPALEDLRSPVPGPWSLLPGPQFTFSSPRRFYSGAADERHDDEANPQDLAG